MPISTISSDLKLLEPFWNEGVERLQLPNGLTVIMKPDHSAALASVQVWVKTGSIHEGESLGAGLSHYLEHLLFKGTKRRSGREISASVQAHGGYINAYTTFDRTVYYIDLPSEHTEVAIDLLADAVLHSTLPAEEVTKEKDVILREIAMTQDDPDDRLWESVFSTSFREHPYRQPVIGHKDVFSATTRETIVSYYSKRYVPNNIVVVVVGAINCAKVKSSIEEHFGKTPRAALAPILISDEPGQLGPREANRFEDVEVSRVAISWQIPGLTHPDAPILDLLSMILGSGDSSILWQQLHEKTGLVHSIDSSSWNPGTCGLFCISFTSDGDKRLEASKRIDFVLKQCRKKGFSPTQIRKAIRQLVVAEIARRQTMSGQASRLGTAEIVVGDLGFSRSYFERLARVTPQDLKRVLNAYLVDEHRSVVSINPSATKKESLEITVKPGSSDKIEEITLKNGARLLIQIDRRLPNVHMRLLAQGGPMHEDEKARGATALLANLLVKDTKTRTATEVAEYIEEVGGMFTPFYGSNSIGLAVEVLPPDVERALTLITDAVLNPTFTTSSFKLEKDTQCASLRRDHDDVVTEARKILRKTFFGKHPFSLDSQGELSGVETLSVQDIKALYKKLFVASNIVFSISGDISAAIIVKIKTFLLKLPKGSAPKTLTKEQLPAFPANVGLFKHTRAREQAVVLQAYLGPDLLDPDFYIGEVADELFSGMASQLFERVREQKALAYFVRSSRITGLNAGMFFFYAGTQPGKENEVLEEINLEIKRVASGKVQTDELERCKARLKAGRRQGLQTNAAKAFHAGLDVLQGRAADHWKQYDSKIEAVSIEDLARFANKYFNAYKMTQVIVSP
jgi:zinc protease